MENNFQPALRIDEIAPGGMKSVELQGREIVICNCSGEFYALSRRCGHMNAPLEMGTLDGKILTCAMHCAQFDVTTGEVYHGPVPRDFYNETPPPGMGVYLQNIDMLMKPVKTESVRTYAVKTDQQMIWVDIK